jgi:hypothetical protein
VQQRFEQQQQQQQEDVVAATAVHLVYIFMSNTAVGCNKPRQLAPIGSRVIMTMMICT